MPPALPPKVKSHHLFGFLSLPAAACACMYGGTAVAANYPYLSTPWWIAVVSGALLMGACTVLWFAFMCNPKWVVGE